MKTLKMTITTKKSTTQDLTFGITQRIPYARIGGRGWENDGQTLFRGGGNAPKGLESRFCVVLLRSDVEEWDESSAKAYAGNDENEGAITLRGVTLGVLVIEATKYFGRDWSYSISVRSSQNPTDGESKFLRANVCPKIGSFIDANLKPIYTEAVNKIEQHLKARISEQENMLVRVKAEAAQAVKTLKETAQ